MIFNDFFIVRLNRYYRKFITGISPDAKELLKNYPWPGNIRELENAIEQAFILADKNSLEIKHFPFEIRRASENGIPPRLLKRVPVQKRNVSAKRCLQQRETKVMQLKC